MGPENVALKKEKSCERLKFKSNVEVACNKEKAQTLCETSFITNMYFQTSCKVSLPF
jgi:hypothetical protein